MKNNLFPEIINPMLLIILLILLLDPFMVLMPTPVQMLLLVIILIVFASFSLFVWKEKSKDEREVLHRNIASRFAYISGSFVLVVGIIIQSFNHNLDPWLLIALIVMIIAKISGSVYAKSKF